MEQKWISVRIVTTGSWLRGSASTEPKLISVTTNQMRNPSREDQTIAFCSRFTLFWSKDGPNQLSNTTRFIQTRKSRYCFFA